MMDENNEDLIESPDYPDLSKYEEIAIDFDTKDPDLKTIKENQSFNTKIIT